MKAYGLRSTVDGKDIRIEIDYKLNPDTTYNLTTDDTHPLWIVPSREIASNVSSQSSCMGRTEFINPYHQYKSHELEIIEYYLNEVT